MKSEPKFDPAQARPCPPTRHAPTGRTFAFRQPEAPSGAAAPSAARGQLVHLFSATGVFVATEPSAQF